MIFVIWQKNENHLVAVSGFSRRTFCSSVFIVCSKSLNFLHFKFSPTVSGRLEAFLSMSYHSNRDGLSVRNLIWDDQPAQFMLELNSSTQSLETDLTREGRCAAGLTPARLSTNRSGAAIDNIHTAHQPHTYAPLSPE